MLTHNHDYVNLTMSVANDATRQPLKPAAHHAALETKMNFRNSRFGGHQNFAAGTRTLTMDELRNRVPSAFAASKHESRSTRYTYIPTVNVIEGLMREGFQPTAAVQGTSRVEGKENFTKHMIRFRHSERRHYLPHRW
jgi:hypothetical protein